MKFAAGILAAIAGLVTLAGAVHAGNDDPIVIGSKNFTESYVLAEIMAQTLESAGYPVRRRFGFGGTKISFDALASGEIDVYPEYTGTLREILLENGRASDGGADALPALLKARGLQMLPSFGFNNTYALAMDADHARQLGIERISDLAGHDTLVAGFSHEFLSRSDGWPGLARTYNLNISVTGIEHGLAYQALAAGDIDLTDAYSTDGELLAYGLRLLQDDRGYFPRYFAVPLVRKDLDPAATDILRSLANQLDEDRMRPLNARAVTDGIPIEQVAQEFLTPNSTGAHSRTASLLSALLRNTTRHLELTASALLAACIGAILLAMLVYRSPPLSRAVIYIAGLLQTIPSIALLALMIPLFGVGVLPAIIALFLYSLLPILRNAVTALTTVDPVCSEVAEAMGMSTAQQLRHVLLPLAAPHIIAGVRTAAVICIGTATLAAFIGAGGLGDPIVTGLALNDTGLILQGALPAAALAICTELLFAALERRLIPEHLRAT